MKSLLSLPLLTGVLSLGNPSFANANTIFGLDCLALPLYSDVALKEFPQGWALGAFANTFGDALPAIEKIVASGKTPHVRIQLVWDDDHRYGDNDIPTIKKEAKRYQKLAVKYPSVRFELSPFCEHEVSSPDKYLEIVAKEAPNCFPVNTPQPPKGGISKKFKNETHKPDKALKGSYNFSYDGGGCVDLDVTKTKQIHAGADVQFFWTYQFNLNMNDNDKTPRSQRKAVPTSALIRSVIYLAKDKQATGLPKDYLWKSHADQHEAPVPESRALKPVLIAPVKTDKIELVANGKVVAELPYYGTYDDGNSGDRDVQRYRYYLGDFGYQVAEKAVKLQGSPVLSLRVNGKVVGKINPAFREGTFR